MIQEDLWANQAGPDDGLPSTKSRLMESFLRSSLLGLAQLSTVAGAKGDDPK
ncbi:rCG63705 [Rattus norvegicus]|uniref:RCG63705 n=1 Tax=Rattus norvegicus TaxID=10116 RepID=A6IFY2_RAT|nr:rCG63705 [Rattus norvegicus]